MLCALLGERLCQQIGKLILSVDMSDVNSPAVNQIANKVKINLDMFHPGVMYQIVTKMCGSKIVA
jgi:hypothetical protein